MFDFPTQNCIPLFQVDGDGGMAVLCGEAVALKKGFCAGMQVSKCLLLKLRMCIRKGCVGQVNFDIVVAKRIETISNIQQKKTRLTRSLKKHAFHWYHKEHEAKFFTNIYS